MIGRNRKGASGAAALASKRHWWQQMAISAAELQRSSAGGSLPRASNSMVVVYWQNRFKRPRGDLQATTFRTDVNEAIIVILREVLLMRSIKTVKDDSERARGGSRKNL